MARTLSSAATATISSTASRATTSPSSAPATTTFQWDPGDGSDVVEGGDGFDTLLFNGSGANEIFEVSANGGRALFTRLGRDSRKWNTCVLAASQNPADVLGMDVANFMSAAFVGRIEDHDAAQDGLRMLRVQTGVGYERALATLSSQRGTDGRSGFREFVMRDVDGHVDKIRVDLTANPGLLEALNTTAAPPARAVSGLDDADDSEAVA